jgi:hypothetical protein
MKTTKTLFAAAALVLAATFPTASNAQVVVVLTENFNDIDMLSGWEMSNLSEPLGQSWFQGNPGVFAAHQGPASSYIAANYLSAADGEGSINNWLITPVLNLIGPSTLTFFTRSVANELFNDTLEVRFASGSGDDPDSFTSLLATVGGAELYPTSWQQITARVQTAGTGRFAFRYTGDAEASNFIGIDTVTITAIPEPAAYLMLGAGLIGVALRRRRTASEPPLGD